MFGKKEIKIDCSTFPARWQKFREESETTIKEYDNLPYGAKSDSMKPNSVQGEAEKEKAKALEKKLFNLSLQAEQLREESEECYNSKSTFTP